MLQLPSFCNFGYKQTDFRVNIGVFQGFPQQSIATSFNRLFPSEFLSFKMSAKQLLAHIEPLLP